MLGAPTSNSTVTTAQQLWPPRIALRTVPSTRPCICPSHSLRPVPLSARIGPGSEGALELLHPIVEQSHRLDWVGEPLLARDAQVVPEDSEAQRVGFADVPIVSHPSGEHDKGDAER